MFLNNYKKLLYTSVACISLLATPTANAAPQGGSVSNGIATIEQNNLKTDIYQNSDKAIIDWNSFDLNTNEQVQFHHPQTSSITLNRVHDTKTSQIDGLLTANGHVMIINENGVVFGENAHIDVGALTVTTADINNLDFMSGDFNFQHKGSADGHIINNGTISVKDSGLINLVAPHLENNGLLIAKMGKVQLAATQAFTLDLAGDGLIQIQIQESDAEYLIKNSGNIQSHDGYISLTTNTARNIVDSLVDNSGVLEATSLHNNGGKIVLSAHNGTTRNSGTIDSSGKNGGGTILIGGDYQGQGDIPTSSNTITTKTSLIKADAIDQGNGGKVIVWGDNTTVFAGNIEANGGENSGDGGFAETSGKANLHVENGARVNVATRAEDGKGGEWLLDPSNVLIQGSMGDNISSSGGIIDPSSDSYTINPDSITAALNNGSNVTITTTNAGGTQDGNIVINSAFIEKSTANNDVTLTFKAHHNIDISYSNIISSNDSLNIILNSDIDQTTSSGGGVQIQYAIIDTNGGDFIIGGGSDPTTMFTQGNTDLSRGTNGVFIQYATIETDAGDIIINGKGLDGVIASRGIVSKDAVFSTTSGDITLHGIGGTGGKSNAGISLENNGMQILSSSGHISITGETTDTLENAHSIILAKGADIILSDTASLEMVALSAATNSTNSDGVRISDAGTTISAVDGDIILRGSAMANLSGTDGILLYQEPVISSSGSGDIILEGSADSSGYAIRILGGTIEHTGTGSIYMTGTGSSTADVYVGTASTVTTSSGNGDIHISGNELYFLNTFNITSSDSIFITPVTDNTSIGLGVNGVSGTLNLINTELAGLSANTVVIGNQNTGTGTVAIDNLDLSTLSFDLEVYGGEQSLNGLTLGTGNFTAHAQEGSNITSTGSISKTLTGDGTLNLMAYGYISISNDIIASNGSLDIILNSDTNVNQKGAIYIDNSTIDSNNGDIILGGGLDPINDFAYGSQPLSNKSGIRLISSNISSGSGDISMKGRGLNNYGYSRGIFLSSSSLTTTSGDISLHGIGGKKGGGYNYGVFIEQSQSFLTSDSGHIDITAYTNNANQEAHAYFQDNGADIILNGTASLEINGHSGANNGSNSDGVRFKGTGTTVTTTDGDVILNGIAETDQTGVDGIILYQGASITGLGSGDIILNGTSAPLGYAVRMLTDTSITHSGAGDVRLSTTGSSSSIDALRIEDNSIIDTSAGIDSNIFLTTDSLRITSSSVTSSDKIYITPENDTTTIGLGGGSGSLHLLSSEILSLSANTVIIGAQDTGTGTISINNPPISTIDFGLELHGGDIIVDTGGLEVGPSLLMKASGNITLNGDVSANGSGNSLTLVTDGTFTNNAGSNALDAGSGRYLVYANNSANIIRGGLTGKSLYNSNYTNNDPSTISSSLNSRFVYNYQPTLTVVLKDLTINYYNPNYNSFTYYVSGLENGDLKNDAISGTALYTTQETDTVTKRRITMDTNALTSPIGYALTYPQPGYLTMLMQQSFSKSVMPQVSNTPGTRTSNKTTQTPVVTPTASPTQGAKNSPQNALIKADKKIEIDFDLCSYNSGYCSE